jgi:glycosyltransferase involved in cell wall biosynthesis
MKILIVTQYFWPENFRINDLATALNKKGHQVEVLTGIPNYPGGRIFRGYSFWGKENENFNGIKIHRVPLIPRGNGGGVRLFLNYISFVVFACLLGPFACREKVDRILVYEPSPVTVCLPAILLKWVKDAPILFWVQDLWPETLSATGAVKSKITLKIVGIIVQFIYRRCDLILVQSRAFVSSIKRFGITQERIAYFPNSAEQFYRPVSPDTCSALENKIRDGFRIMFAGNIGSAQDFKAILDTVEILKANKQIQWIVLGDGRMRPWVEKQINTRGLENNIKLLGRYPAEEMPKYFSHADALLVTLKKDPIFALTIPAKVQSYLACAKPIIAAIDGEGASIIIEAGAGLVCPSENPQQLAKTVMRLHGMSKEELDKMGQSGRKYFEKHFERNMLVDRFENLLNHFPRENFKCEL